MFPGTTTKISETVAALSTSIAAKTDLVRITSTTVTTVLATILPNFGAGFSGILLLVNDSGNPINFVTTGNIEVARTVPDNMLIPLAFSKLSGKWYPGAIS
jgi:hypothetical protein